MFSAPSPEIRCRAGAGGADVRGFTLMEILVAVTILSIVLVTVYGGLTRTLFAKGYAEERAELYTAGREAVLKIAEEMEAALPPNARRAISFRALSRGDRPPNDAVQFSINTHSGLRSMVPRAGRSTITYSLDPLSSSAVLFILRRDELPLVSEGLQDEDETLEEEPEESEPTALYLLDPTDCYEERFCVAGLQFRFLDPRSSEWVSEWDSTQQEQFDYMPVAAEISLSLLDKDGDVHGFRTIVDLVLARSTLPTPTPVQ